MFAALFACFASPDQKEMGLESLPPGPGLLYNRKMFPERAESNKHNTRNVKIIVIIDKSQYYYCFYIFGSLEQQYKQHENINIHCANNHETNILIFVVVYCFYLWGGGRHDGIEKYDARAWPALQ